MTSPDKPIHNEMIPRLYQLSNTICDSIKKQNTVKINIDQRVNNISKTGIQLQVDNEELAKYISDNPEEIVFDLFPDHRMKFTIKGRIMNMLSSEKNGFKVGVQILPGKGKNDLVKWQQFIDKYIKTLFY
jgi:hypothetical protein